MKLAYAKPTTSFRYLHNANVKHIVTILTYNINLVHMRMFSELKPALMNYMGEKLVSVLSALLIIIA